MSDLSLPLATRALLLILMAENAELSNKQIEERYAAGLKLTGKQRLKLVEEKLIECRKGERNAYYFTLAERGWAWCREELTAQVPSGSGSAGQACYAILRRLGDYLDTTTLSLSNVFGAQPAVPAVSAAPAAVRLADELELDIRRAYRKIAGTEGAWVDLADLRDEVPDVPRSQLDAVLRLMTRMPGVRVEEETNQKKLSSRDRDAAVTIGARAQHMLAIESL